MQTEKHKLHQREIIQKPKTQSRRGTNKKTIYSCRDPIRCNQWLQTCPKEMVCPHPPQRCPGQCRQPFFKKEVISTQKV